MSIFGKVVSFFHAVQERDSLLEQVAATELRLSDAYKATEQSEKRRKDLNTSYKIRTDELRGKEAALSDMHGIALDFDTQLCDRNRITSLAVYDLSWLINNCPSAARMNRKDKAAIFDIIDKILNQE